MTLPNEINYQVAFENADHYRRFKIDGSEFTHDITLGLSKFGESSGQKFEVVIGGWVGTGSIIRNRTSDDEFTDLIPHATHSREEFDNFKNDIELIATDGQIIVKANGNVLMQYEDSSIKKSELKYLLATGGWNGHGTLTISGCTATETEEETTTQTTTQKPIESTTTPKPKG